MTNCLADLQPIQVKVHFNKLRVIDIKSRVTVLLKRVKGFNLRVFLRVKMLNILGNLRVAHQ